MPSAVAPPGLLALVVDFLEQIGAPKAVKSLKKEVELNVSFFAHFCISLRELRVIFVPSRHKNRMRMKV